MLTLGIDLASSPKNTAICRVSWTVGRAVVDEIKNGVEDPELVQAINQCEKSGIDIPLGWPEGFVDSITAHRNGSAWPSYPKADLCYRETDGFVRRLTRRPLLSVSSDRIAIPAMRAAALVSFLSPPVDRIGEGRLVEVYPVVALFRWGFGRPHYKGPKRIASRKALVNSFLGQTGGWLQCAQRWQSLCENSDHAFDALVSALVARAKPQGLCEAIPPAVASKAAREGWIAVPTAGSLNSLC